MIPVENKGSAVADELFQPGCCFRIRGEESRCDQNAVTSLTVGCELLFKYDFRILPGVFQRVETVFQFQMTVVFPCAAEPFHRVGVEKCDFRFDPAVAGGEEVIQENDLFFGVHDPRDRFRRNVSRIEHAPRSGPGNVCQRIPD